MIYLNINWSTSDGKLEIWIPYVSNEIVVLANELHMNLENQTNNNSKKPNLKTFIRGGYNVKS